MTKRMGSQTRAVLFISALASGPWERARANLHFGGPSKGMLTGAGRSISLLATAQRTIPQISQTMFMWFALMLHGSSD